MIRLFEWDPRTWLWVPARLGLSLRFSRAIIAWVRSHDAISGTACTCMLDCRGGVYLHGDELRQHRGRWTVKKLQRVARLIGYEGEVTHERR
jgi:hypothetical protein